MCRVVGCSVLVYDMGVCRRRQEASQAEADFGHDRYVRFNFGFQIVQFKFGDHAHLLFSLSASHATRHKTASATTSTPRFVSFINSNMSLPVLAATEATAIATAAVASLPLSPLIHALRNAFLHLKDAEFESEVIIERQRRKMRALLSSKQSKNAPTATASGSRSSRQKRLTLPGSAAIAAAAAAGNNNIDAIMDNKKSNSLANVTLPLATRTAAAAEAGTTTATDCEHPPYSPLRFPLEPTLEMLSPEDDDDHGAGTAFTSPLSKSSKKKRAASSKDMRTNYQNVDSIKKLKTTTKASAVSAANATAIVAATATVGVTTAVAAAYERVRHQNMHEKNYNTYLAQLHSFQSKFGHFNVPKKSGGASDDDDATSYEALHAWLTRQKAAWRNALRGGATSSYTLSQERIARFMALGMEPPVLLGPAFVNNSVDNEYQQPMASSVTRSKQPMASSAAQRSNRLKGCKTQQQQALWDMHYSSLLAFREEKGHTNVPGKNPAFSTLYNWLTIQRQEWRKVVRGESSSLNEVHIQKLTDAGLGSKEGPTNPKVQNETMAWERSKNELIEFKEIHGHVNVSEHTHGENYKKLAGWVRQQKINYQNMQHIAATGKKKDMQGGIMTKTQLEQLEDIDQGFFSPRSQKLTFADRLVQLTEYFSLNGHTNVPLDYTRHQHLGPCITRWKRLYSQGKLGQRRISAIEAIGGGACVFDWGPRSTNAPERDAVSEELNI
jgi:Helicase associated domain